MEEGLKNYSLKHKSCDKKIKQLLQLKIMSSKSILNKSPVDTECRDI